VTGASGDWHDVFPMPSGHLAVVVGDAQGRGADAVPLKNALQRALRGLATAGMGPGEVLSCLRTIVDRIDDGLATLVYAIIGPARGGVMLVNAGHPPPLHVRRDGSVAFLQGGLSPPLGAPCPQAPVPTCTRLRVGEALVLYTDGLIESPRQDVAEGLDRLAAVGRACADASPEDMCNRFIRLGFDGGLPTDDLTALALRLNEPEPTGDGRRPQPDAG
jgi:serine phosphatase RsbU (regulator of sigma subunit)